MSTAGYIAIAVGLVLVAGLAAYRYMPDVRTKIDALLKRPPKPPMS